jgi:hypothetical protein
MAIPSFARLLPTRPFLLLLLLLFSFVASARVHAQPAPPLLSIIFITKRPGAPPYLLHGSAARLTHAAGGYDILLSSLAQQTSTAYELICQPLQLQRCPCPRLLTVLGPQAWTSSRPGAALT